jgi:NitT/TauT family transport system ATP-binding protein
MSGSAQPDSSQVGAISAEATSDAHVEQRGRIKAVDVNKAFESVVALDGFNMVVEAHSRVALVGPSGCGKSTFLSIAGGLEECTSGAVTIDGEAASTARLARCALMPQKDLLLPWRTALENACLALENQGVARREAQRRAAPLFERFGLASAENLRPAKLSGGMRQRVAFLRTLLAGKDVLLLDEPFGALDALTRASVQEWLLTALAAEPRTTLLVTHDVEEALLLCDRVFVMSSRPGRVVLTLDVDVPKFELRRETISSPEFVALKETALTALEE